MSDPDYERHFWSLQMSTHFTECRAINKSAVLPPRWGTDSLISRYRPIAWAGYERPCRSRGGKRMYSGFAVGNLWPSRIIARVVRRGSRLPAGLAGAAMTELFLDGMLTFPGSTLVLKLMEGSAASPKQHPGRRWRCSPPSRCHLDLLVAIALGLYDPILFFPASIIVVGAHYLVFISLYGMRFYAVLAALLASVGIVTPFWLSGFGGTSGWVGVVVCCLSAPRRTSLST